MENVYNPYGPLVSPYPILRKVNISEDTTQNIDAHLQVSHWVWYRISTGTRQSIASKLMYLAIILFFSEFYTVKQKIVQW